MRSLPDSELCDVWRETWLVVAAVETPAALEQVAAFRQAYRSELERRDPRTVAWWLDCPDLAVGPEPWIDGPR